MPSHHTPALHSHKVIASQVAAQFKHSRFTREQYLIDQALMKRVDQAPCITFSQFRVLAKRQGWTVDSLAAIVKDELDEPKRTMERILKTGPVDTVIPYTCLIELYQKVTAKSAEGKPTGKGYCEDGCGQRVMGRQEFATDACRKQTARSIA